MEELGVFDVLGPIMVGPSSNHTGGACRIGIAARHVLGAEPASLTMGFWEVTLARSYRGHATDRAIVHGLLGGKVDDVSMRQSLIRARERGLRIGVEAIPSPVPDNNIMRCDMTDVNGNRTVMTGFSIGGGSVIIADVDGFPLNLDGNGHVLLVECEVSWYEETLAGMLDILGIARQHITATLRLGTIPGTHPVHEAKKRTLMAVARLAAAPQREALESVSRLPHVIRARYLPPVKEFFRSAGVNPEPITFDWMMEKSPEPLHRRIAEREATRDARTVEEVIAEMHHVLEVMREARDLGVSGKLDMLCGMDDGLGAKRLLRHEKSGRALSGSTLIRAAAYAIAINSVNASMGRIVACPTGGSSGTLPGTLLAVMEAAKVSDDDAVNALLVAAGTGAAIGRLCSFSGTVGGCMGEIGFASAMAAAAVAYIETEDAEAACHAAALAIKSTLGLVCDPPAGPVEIPCIKRNGTLVGVALTSGEMAAAGIRSAIPPDEVVLAAKNVQEILPQALKGNLEASLGCTPTARAMKARWAEVLAREEPV